MAQANADRPPDLATGAEPTPLPTAAARFVRGDHLASDYSPGRHAALTVAIATALTAVGGFLAARARPLDWALAPVFFVVANFIEWMVHRHPMHHPQPPRFMYTNHTLLHHLAFTDGNMPITRPAELGLVMMPWYTMIGLFVLASPIMVLAGFIRGPGLAGVFLLAAVAYFLMYETLHALYHLPGESLDRLTVGKSHLFRRMQAHHAHHHVLGRMAHVNFNVTFPLMDVVLGTNEPSE